MNDKTLAGISNPRSDKDQEIESLKRRLGAINTLACYASEEDTDAQPQALLAIGRIARGEDEPLWPII